MAEKLSDDDRANLVAYLDGELDEATSHALEVKLDLDPNARADVEGLKQVWELLDYLPPAAASPTFTHRTVERISALRPTTGLGNAVRRRAWSIGLGWAAALLIAGGLGYEASSLLAPRKGAPVEPVSQEQLLVRDLRAVEHLELYQYVDDMDFLRSLDHPDLFGDDSAGRQVQR